MLDGRVLGASQVEYKPFGKPPLKREEPDRLHRPRSKPPNTSKTGLARTSGRTRLDPQAKLLFCCDPRQGPASAGCVAAAC